MNFMKKKTIWIAALLFLAVVLAWLFWPKGTGSALRVIPADAGVLVEIDVPEFVRESDMSVEKSMKLFSDISGIRIDQVSDPGIDLNDKLYMFMDAGGTLGAACPVADADALKHFLQTCAAGDARMEEQQGYQWCYFGNMLWGFDEHVALVMGPVLPASEKEQRQQMVAYLNQKEKESAEKSMLYKQLEKQDGIVKAVTSLENIPDSYKMFQNMGLPEHLDLSKMQLAASLHSEKGRVIVKTNLITDDKNLAQRFRAFNDMCDRIDGSFIRRAPKNSLFWLGTNMRGGKFVTHLRQFPGMRLYLAALNRIIDADKILSCIDGDVAVSGSLAFTPDIRIYAQMKDRSYIDEADYWIDSAPGRSFTRIDEDVYKLNVASTQVFMGLEDRNLHLALSRPALNEMSLEDTDLLAAYEQDILESKFYFWFNIAETRDFISLMGLSSDGAQMRYLARFKAMALRALSPTSIECIAYMSKDESGLKQLLESWKE